MPKKIELTVLGSNSSIPTPDKMLSSHVLDVLGSMYMIDCGEGTQIQLTKYKISRNKIKAIFISHFHGDHLYGLPGLLTSYSHFERKDPLTVIGPIGLKKYLGTIFEISSAVISFPIHIIETDPTEVKLIYKDAFITAYHFPLIHRIPTQGYVIITKEQRPNLDKEKLKAMGLAVSQIKAIINGESITTNGKEYNAPYFYASNNSTSKKYLYCSDTSYINQLPEICQNPDLLYHESTYLNDLKEQAFQRGHSTALEAAQCAKNVKAKCLLLGHFSNRYFDKSVFQNEANSIFDNVVVASEGLKITI